MAENLSTKRCHVNSPKKVTVSCALCRCMHTAHKYNKSRESYGALHPVSDTADWWGWQGECGRGCRIDSGRWRRGHRLALLGVMTLTQCSAMASSSPLSLPLLRSSSAPLSLFATLTVVFPPTSKKGWKRLCVRGVAAQGVRGCLGLAYRSLRKA